MTFLSARFARWLLAASPVAVPAWLPAQETGVTRISFQAIPARLVNLGVRAMLGSGETSISGFYITEATSATLLVRAAGPALAAYGVPAAMANPKLEIYDADGNLVVTNDDWSAKPTAGAPESLAWSVPQAVQLVGAFPFPAESRDAAIVVTLKPGAYTLVISGSTATDTGTVLGEIYQLPIIDVTSATPTGAPLSLSRVTNLSTRGRIVDKDSVVIGSFVVGGSTLPTTATPTLTPADAPSKRFLIRVVGPGLLPYGVTDALPDPMLELKGTNGIAIQMNDNWDADPEAAKLIRETSASVGAFALEPGSRDAVAIARLPEGAYSVLARGANGATGTVLIEIYELPD